MFALSLYMISHKFTLSLTAYKGKIKGKRNRTNRTDFCIKHSSGRELIVPTAFPKEKILSFSQKRYNATSIRFIKIAIGKVQNDHPKRKVCLTSEFFLL